MALLFGLLVGVGMGWLLQRVGASNPRVIAGNLRLEQLTIIKFMLLTIAVGTVASHALALVIPMHFDIKPLYLAGVLLGGLIFGVGFAVGGYCPGTCVVGAGEGRRDALFAIAGGVVGALAFTLVYPAAKNALIAPWNFGAVTLPSALGLPRLLVAGLVAAAFIWIVIALPSGRRRGTVPAGPKGR